MKENKQFALTVSLFVLIGLPFIFFAVSLFTGNWLFFVTSIAPALAGGLTGLILTMQKIKKEKQAV